MNTVKNKYWTQKACAKRRGIDFNLSFEQWWTIWEKSGKWDQRGCKKGQYVMSRINDSGSYDIDNVFIQQHSNNISEAQTGQVRKHLSDFMKTHWNLYRKQKEYNL